jgi:HKD family nuclease
MIITTCYILQPNKSELSGTHTAHAVSVTKNDVQLLIDSTAFNLQSGKRIICQENFDKILALIKEARMWIYVDFFLWNQYQGSTPENHRQPSKELAEALICKKQDCPETNILVLTDPINRTYGNMDPEFFHRMKDVGIGVVFTDLSRLNDSNIIYSLPINTIGACLKKIPWINKLLDKAFLPNIIDINGNQISLRQMGRLFFFKANHRKVIITDTADGSWQMLVTSFNPADGSSAHSNCGLLVFGDLALAALSTELACTEWSAANQDNCLGDAKQPLSLFKKKIQRDKDTIYSINKDAAITCKWLTEGAILTCLLDMIKSVNTGDEIRIAIFYLSERSVIQAIKAAAKKGANIKIIMDANRDAFGHIKIGIPNRPVAAELLNAAKKHNLNIAIRWADTHGEQFHHKAVCIINKDRQKYQFMCGSANWTRRNLADLNLEANLFVDNAPEITSRFIEYFEQVWNNNDGLKFTTDYYKVGEKGWTLFWKTIVYRLQEATGACTF